MVEGSKSQFDLTRYSELDDPKVRRQLRASYRSLENDLQEKSEDATNPGSTVLHEGVEKLEKYFEKARHPREAVQDSAVLLTITKKCREQAQQLKSDVVSFDNPTFAEKLITYVGGHRIDADGDESVVNLNLVQWKKLGDMACCCFANVPKIDFLLGPLVLEVVIKEKPVRRAEARKKGAEGELVKLKQVVTEQQQEEATTKEVERILKILKKVTNGGKNNVCFFQFIVNPHSFAQTVENLFHLSFLIKDGRVVVDLDDNDLPFVNLHQQYREDEDREGVPRKQVVLPLTVKEWQRLIEVYEIRNCMIPTRAKIFNS